MRTWDTVIKKGLYMYVHRADYAYFYGAKGEVLTDAVMNTLIRCYPNHFKKYTPKQLDEIKAYSNGRIGYDCSGFITSISGIQGNSTMQFDTCHDITDNLAAGPAGSLLHRSGHIGIDIGYGFFLHMPREGESIVLGKISEYPWDLTGQSYQIDMEGSDSR